MHEIAFLIYILKMQIITMILNIFLIQKESDHTTRSTTIIRFDTDPVSTTHASPSYRTSNQKNKSPGNDFFKYRSLKCNEQAFYY